MRHKVDSVNHSGSAVGSGGGDRGGDDNADPLDLIHTVMHRFRSLQFQVLRDSEHGVTHMDSKVLGFFARHPGATQSDLAQHSGRDKAQLARLVAGLRERGLLVAEADANDRRSIRLQLSAEGLAVQRTLQQQGKRLTARAVAGFSAAERTQLVALLQRVRGNLEADG